MDDDPVPDLATLRREAGAISLELAANIVRKVGAAKVTVPVVVDLLRELAGLYPKRVTARDELSGSRYFIRALVETLDLPVVVAALDNLTHNLVCTCSPRYDTLCECRGGVSKVAGLLLDRHFSIGTPADAEASWGWLRNLHFRDYRASDSSAAVAALGNAHELRRQIQWLALNTGPEKTNDAMGRLFTTSTHSGIRFHVG